MPKYYELAGQRFERLEVIEYAGIRNQDRMWRCRCDCGEETSVGTNNLTSGNTKSCGCLARERAVVSGRQRVKHGYSRKGKIERTYASFMAAKQRCLNCNSPDYPTYGGSGIKFLFESVTELVAHIGDRPVGKSLDRYPDPYGNYEKGNVRWATPKEQSNNLRKRLTPSTKRAKLRTMPNINIPIPDDLLKKIRVACAKDGFTQKEWVVARLEEAVNGKVRAKRGVVQEAQVQGPEVRSMREEPGPEERKGNPVARREAEVHGIRQEHVVRECRVYGCGLCKATGMKDAGRGL